jgi:hypothetical protein
MRTVTFKRILEGVARRMGVDPAGVSFTTELVGFIAEAADDRLRRIWESEFWPELMRVEERPLRIDWAVTETYGDGDEVYAEDSGGEGSYYVSQAAGNVGNDPTSDDGSWWTVVGDDFDRYLPLELDGYTDMGEVEFANEVDPRSAATENTPRRIEFWLSENGLQLPDDAPARVWVRFRLRPPKLTGTVWSATTTYAEGDRVYLASTGQCYVALGASTNVSPDGNTTEWERQNIPEFLEELLKLGAAVDMLTGEGQMEKALAMDTKFDLLLLDTKDKVLGAQGQATTVKWEGYW